MLEDVNVRVSLVSILVQIVSQALRLKTIRIYRLHAWPEIKRSFSFACMLSSFLLPFFGYLKHCFHGIILRVFCIPFLVSWLYQNRRNYIRYS